MRPLRDYLIVKRAPLEKKSESGRLYIVEHGMSLFADVIAAGPKCEVRPGQRIVLGGWKGKVIPSLDGEMLRIRERDAEAVVE